VTVSARHRAPGRSVAIALAASAALALTGCGAGQISQTAQQVAAVPGNHAESGPLALRDVRIVFPTEQSSGTKQAALAFSLVNTSADVADELQSVSVAGANATIQPASPELKPQQTLLAVSFAEREAQSGADATDAQDSEPANVNIPARRPLLV